MKSSTQLHSAIFQLTPTRTRCDLIIIANEKKEKIASGLLTPFLAHLKTAQDQIVKGGYSITLEPDADSDATWFTKGTVERFVRFVSTPEILERVYTIESEILQIVEAIAIQGRNDMVTSTVDDRQAKLVVSSEGNKPVRDVNEEKAIVLYKPDTHPPEANGSVTQEGNSKVQLLKVLETRKAVLQKEQGMAFARAVAAGFDIDHMALLVSFAECFGASRLMDACSRFMDLWKRKHETGQWLEIEATEAMSSDFSTMNASGIMLSSVANKQNESCNELAAENSGKTGIDTSTGDKPPMNYQIPVSQQEYFQGQFPHPMFPPWPIHSPPGALPVFQAYPMQGMPYYQNCPGNASFYQPQYPPMEDSLSNVSHKTGLKRQSMDGRDSTIELENHGNLELEKEVSQRQEPRKKAGRSYEKKSGMVVIRNINYITSNAKNSASSESESASESETDMDGEDVRADGPDISSRRKGSHAKSMEESNLYDKEEITYGKETDDGHWQAFQTSLLRAADEDDSAAKEGMFATEKDVQMRRRNVSRKLMSNDEISISGYDNHRGAVDDHTDMHFTERDGRKVMYRRKEGDDFMIGGRENQSELGCSSGFQGATYNMDRKSSHGMADESFIVPFRSMSLDHVGSDGRTPMDMDSELQSTCQMSENISNGIGSQFNYEPNDLSLMPERGTGKRSIGYDPALDYKMQVCVEDATSLEKRNKEVVIDVKQGSKKDKERRSNVTPDTSEKKKSGGPIRKGKPSKVTPLHDARARAEKLRAYKSDLQKMKKEKEEAELKRFEELKRERQKRIAAKGGSKSAHSQLPSPQSRKFPSKLSPINHGGSKFRDSEPRSSSPLQRSKVRTASFGSNDFQKASKALKSSDGSHLEGNKLRRSVPSLSERKKESSGVTPDSKASIARIRRLSEPKSIRSPLATSIKLRSSSLISKPKVFDGPESKKISAIISLDKSKAATLPELKIRTFKGPSNVSNKSATKEMERKVNGGRPSVTSEWNTNNHKVSHHNDVDDSPIVEKTVVMLECEKPSVPVTHDSEEKKGPLEVHYDSRDVGEEMKVVPDYAAIHAPPSTIDEGDREFNPSQLREEASSYKVTTNHAPKESLRLASIGIAEKPYQVPYARVSTLEEVCTEHSDYDKAPLASSEMLLTDADTVKTDVYDGKSLKVEMISEAVAKLQIKESSKGFRRLLKFRKKNHSSTAGERSVESDGASVNGPGHDHNNAMNSASSSEVYTLKNLISQDETSTASQKSSRHFSLLSPFRSKTSEKKLTA